MRAPPYFLMNAKTVNILFYKSSAEFKVRDFEYHYFGVPRRIMKDS